MLRGWLWILCATLAAALAPMDRAEATAGRAGTPLATCVAPVRPGDTAARLIAAAPSRFDCATPQVDHGSGSFWLRSASLPPDAAGMRLRWSSVWQGRVTVHVLYADGALVALPLDQQMLSRRLQLGATIEQALPVRAAAPVRVLWRVDDAANIRGILPGAMLASEAQSARANTARAALYGAFAGLCLALLVYNLALWGVLRHRFQIAYCAMLVALLGYAASSSGALAWWVEGIANNDRMRVNYITLSLSAAAALAFARSFFGARVFSGWLARASSVVAVALIAAGAAFAALAPWQARLLDLVFASSFVLLLLLVFPILWRARQARSDHLWLFVLAWAAPIAFAVLRTAGNFRLVPWGFWLDNSTLIAMSIEALLSSIAIALRVRQIARDRDAACGREMAARVLADTDPLTGLMNRRAFLRDSIGRSGPQVLHLLDIDHFKQVNDRVGHDGGDEVLRVFARVLRRTSAPGTLIARLGGEEFAILGEHPPAAGELLRALRAERMPFDLPVTASIGSASGPLASDRDWQRLYGNADRALFAAKHAGRDRARAA